MATFYPAPSSGGNQDDETPVLDPFLLAGA